MFLGIKYVETNVYLTYRMRLNDCFKHQKYIFLCRTRRISFLSFHLQLASYLTARLKLNGCFREWVNKDCPTKIKCFFTHCFTTLVLKTMMFMSDASDRDNGVQMSCRWGDVTELHLSHNLYSEQQ